MIQFLIIKGKKDTITSMTSSYHMLPFSYQSHHMLKLFNDEYLNESQKLAKILDFLKNLKEIKKILYEI